MPIPSEAPVTTAQDPFLPYLESWLRSVREHWLSVWLTYRFTRQDEQAGDQSPEAEDFQADIENTNECENRGDRLGERVFHLINDTHVC